MKLLILLALFCGTLAQTKDVPEHLSTNKTMAGDENTGVWKNFAGSSYIFYSTPHSWAQAQMTCLAIGGHLAVINNQAEEDFVQGMANGLQTWIGLSDAQEFGLLLWINSDPLGYTNWCPGEPDNEGGNQKCALTNYPGLQQLCWDDQDCDNHRTYVCERKDNLS